MHVIFFPTVYGDFYKNFNQRNIVSCMSLSIKKTNEQMVEQKKNENAIIMFNAKKS